MEDNSKSFEITNKLLGAAGLGVVASVGVALGVGGQAGLTVGFVILLLMVLFAVGYLQWQKLKKKKDSRGFEKVMTEGVGTTPREIKDPKRQADLDKLRRRFLEGIEIYRSRGKDLYSVPWFVIIGESGSGKTEAIRRSNLDFPSGLNDFMQGTGGTLNMDWWFTNHGVILDTAGSMVFPEMGGERAGSPQWQEFLKMLGTHRRHCPVNGLLLVLSVDSLIVDPAAKIASKAGAIARQLDLIQRVLDIRFPVAVLITKCDKLTGFREFFEQVDDPDLQDQILGWSNPEPLDAPFRPEMVDQHLGQVIQRLRKRRLGLLRDPLPSGGARARRIDEVDALYGLPKSFSLIAPRLRRYLETIFVAGAFSAKPVFLRGIYFTSAMQVGADMDEAVWAALGRLPGDTDLAGSNQQDLGRPFFLRHVFLEKVFRERGLVTRATNTKRMLARRKLIFLGATSACLFLVLLFGWGGRRQLKKEIGRQSEAWVTAKKNWNTTEAWNPIVIPGPDPFLFRYQGNEDMTVGRHEEPLSQFQVNLQSLASTNLKVGRIFFPVKWFVRRNVDDAHRLTAQRAVFERSVVLPLIENTRAKMEQEKPGRPGERTAPAPLQQEALKALIRLEADIVRGKHLLGPGMTNLNYVGTNYLFPYLSYLTESNLPPHALDLADVFRRTYQDGWPAESVASRDHAAALNAIESGLDRFFANARQRNTEQQEQLKRLQMVAQATSDFEAEEQKWHRAAATATEIDPGFYVALEARKVAVDKALRTALTNRLFINKTPDSLQFHLAEIRTNSALFGSNAAQGIRLALGDAATKNPFFEGIVGKLAQFQKQLGEGIDVGLPDLSGLDRRSLSYCPAEETTRSYARRFLFYAQGFDFQRLPNDPITTLVGTGWSAVTNLQGQAQQLRGRLEAYAPACGYSGELTQTHNYLVRQGETIRRKKYVDDYAAYVLGQLQQTKDVPSPIATLEYLRTFVTFATNIDNDLTAQSIIPAAERLALGPLRDRIGQTAESVVAKYAGNVESALESKMGFPFLRDSPVILDLPRLQELYRTVLQFSNEVESLEKLFPIAPADLAHPLFLAPSLAPLLAMKERLLKCSAVLRVFFDADGKTANYKILVETNRQSAAVIRAFWGLAASVNGQDAARDISRDMVTFGPFPVNGHLVLASREHPAHPEEKRREERGAWGIMLLLASQGQFSTERSQWEIRFQVGPETSQTIILTPRFNAPLPPEWPTVGSWSNAMKP